MFPFNSQLPQQSFGPTSFQSFQNMQTPFSPFITDINAFVAGGVNNNFFSNQGPTTLNFYQNNCNNMPDLNAINFFQQNNAANKFYVRGSVNNFFVCPGQQFSANPSSSQYNNYMSQQQNYNQNYQMQANVQQQNHYFQNFQQARLTAISSACQWGRF